MTFAVGNTGTQNITFKDCTAGDCVCGGVFRIPDGVYSVNADEQLTAMGSTPEGAQLLRELGVLVQEMVEGGAGVREIRAAVVARAPGLARSLPKTRKALLTFAGAMLIAAASPTAVRVGENVRDNLLGEQKPPAPTMVVPPRGSEGTVITPDGMIMRWGPGVRPTERQ